MNPKVKEFYDKPTGTLSYIIYDPSSKDAVALDPVWNYEQAPSELSLESVLALKTFLQKENLNLHYILETHAHADHISGAQELKKFFPNAKVGIGKNITKVQKIFSDIYHFANFPCDGRQFDLLLENNSLLRAGSLEIKILNTPGHTPACVSYLIGDAVFTGDVIFMPDYGTGRCDFPGGSASDLYASVHETLYGLPDSTRLFTGHDYMPGNRELKFESSIGEEKKKNIHIKAETTKEEYVTFRTERDKDASAPRLLLPSIQLNINAGKLPDPEANGSRYLKIPITSKEPR